MPQRTCGVEGCPKAHRARGLCSTHYNQQHQPNRHTKSTVACAWCGRATLKERGRANRYRKLFCSLQCRDRWRVSSQTNPSPNHSPAARAAAAATRLSRRRLCAARRKLRKAAQGTRGTTWTAGRCLRCQQPFVSHRAGDEAGRYCSNTCKRRAKRSRRRARIAGVRHEPYSRIGIFERDQWRCHICRRLTLRSRCVPHPRAPVLDHLVPIAAGGDDVAANVATACFLCNSIKGQRGGNEQLALFG